MYVSPYGSDTFLVNMHRRQDKDKAKGLERSDRCRGYRWCRLPREIREERERDDHPSQLDLRDLSS